uniref:Uncharacterized protein n=1 Tax=Meloidogyne enterolobii TaxID=390850 RepID=A0A6V7V4H4_MELEN|nr:unnamed protein product [Meloidogyne enterolobii]
MHVCIYPLLLAKLECLFYIGGNTMYLKSVSSIFSAAVAVK